MEALRHAYARRDLRARLEYLPAICPPFLMANTAESRVYRRVGFEPAGEILHISVPA